MEFISHQADSCIYTCITTWAPRAML